jgi:Fe2+ or Zn2+ uptake regulation protein
MKKVFNIKTWVTMSDHLQHIHCVHWLEQMRDSGYRLTAPLKVIVELLAHTPYALSPIDIYDICRREYKHLGLVTVYRTIEKLMELGLVQRVHQVEGCHTYLRSAIGHEHVLICSTCGRVEYFEGDDLSTLIDRTAQRSGYIIQDHWLQLTGLCPQCANNAGADTHVQSEPHAELDR